MRVNPLLQSAAKSGSGEPEKLLITAKEAAAMLGISERFLWTKTNCGEIPCRYIGRAVRYVPGELITWLDQLPRKKA